MGLRFVLFDLDGTLLDTLDDLADATNAALASFGLPVLPVSDYRLLVGNGVRVLMRRAAASAAALAAGGTAGRPDAAPAGGGQPDLPGEPELVAAFNREYDERWANRTQPYAGIPELLNRLRAAGLKLGILSNKPDAFTCAIAERFFPGDDFDLVAGMKPDFPAKPDPGLAYALCVQAGVSPTETALVGDSGSDMQTAVAAGMEPVGVLWGFRSAAELSGSGAHHLARTPQELGDLLLQML